MPTTNRPAAATILLLTLTPLIGCSKSPDERRVELSERANARQQHETIARQTEKPGELSQGFTGAEAWSSMVRDHLPPGADRSN